MSFLSSGDGDEAVRPPKRIRTSGNAFDASFLDDAHVDRRASEAGKGAWSGTGAVRCFSVMWRNHQTRKHKSWEGDGILIVRGTRGKAGPGCATQKKRACRNLSGQGV